MGADAAPHLAELGQRPGVEELLCDRYRLERLCRAAEAEVSTVTGRPDPVGAALLGVAASSRRVRGTAGVVPRSIGRDRGTGHRLVFVGRCTAAAPPR
jgi:hypothetical protein